MIDNRDELEDTPLRTVALDCIEAGIRNAQPGVVVDDRITRAGSTLTVHGTDYDLDAYDRVFVVGGGNAAGKLAAAVERKVGDVVDEGAVVTDVPVETDVIATLEGDHPTPSQRGVESTERIVDIVERAGENDLVLTLITGGGSALMAAPAEGVSLADLQETTEALLGSGATIHEINAVRKHLSRTKGGQLAVGAAPATMVGIVISDVAGDDLSVIASGPAVPDDSTYADALSVLESYDVDVPETVRDRLEAGAAGDRPETPGPEHDVFERVTTHVIASSLSALEAASETAADHGYDPMVLSSTVRGEAREAAKTHVAVAEEIAATGNPLDPPAVVVSGGETTVTLGDDHGEGGPNQEFALSAALEVSTDEVAVASVDSDGIDGASSVAGALVDDSTVETADERIAATDALRRNDVLDTLEEAGALIETGPTGTNVNDLRVVVVGTPDGST